MSQRADSSPYYRLHVFVCTQQRADPSRPGCGNQGALAARDHLKSRAKAQGLAEVRINAAGCLGRCALGPVLVIYPDGAWYRFATIADIDEILDVHLGQGRPVDRLRLDAAAVPVALA